MDRGLEVSWARHDGRAGQMLVESRVDRAMFGNEGVAGGRGPAGVSVSCADHFGDRVFRCWARFARAGGVPGRQQTGEPSLRVCIRRSGKWRGGSAQLSRRPARWAWRGAAAPTTRPLLSPQNHSAQRQRCPRGTAVLNGLQLGQLVPPLSTRSKTQRGRRGVGRPDTRVEAAPKSEAAADDEGRGKTGSGAVSSSSDRRCVKAVSSGGAVGNCESACQGGKSPCYLLRSIQA